MRNLLRLFSAFVLAACALSAPEARADSVVITGGSLTQADNHNFDVTGQGFRASGWGYLGRRPCFTCTAGSVIDLNTEFAGVEELGGGPATFGGTDYPQLWYGGRLIFRTDPFVMPLDSPSGPSPYQSPSP